MHRRKKNRLNPENRDSVDEDHSGSGLFYYI
jgi:hypothetical protein